MPVVSGSLRYPVLVLLAGACLAPLPATVHAADDTETTLEEIIVTAQKREESLSDVPLSVEAVLGDKLTEAGIMRLDDLKAYVPNLQMTETGIANNVYVRGIGSGLNQGFEQSVSTYADGLYRGRGHQSRMPFLDLARVEVLRGPQPILFGKNAVAGAVNLVSAQPTDQLEGSARFWYDHDLKERVVDGVVSGPIGGDFSGRVAARVRNADGYVNNLTLGRLEPDRVEESARATLRWQPGEQLDVTLKLEGAVFETRGRQIEIFGETPSGNAAFGGLTYSQIVSGSPLPLVGLPTGLPQGASASAANNVIDYGRSSQGDTSRLDNQEAVLTVNYRLPNDMTLTAISGHSRYRLKETCDCDFVGATVFQAGVNERYRQVSQEVRLASSTGTRLSWLGGVFYQKYTLRETDYLYLPPTSLAIPVLALNPALGPTAAIRAANAAVFANAANPRRFDTDSELWSVFVQGTWNVTDRFRIAAGGRYSDEEKSGLRSTTLTAGNSGPPLPVATYPLFSAVLGIVPHYLTGKRSENNFSPMVNVQLDFGANSMAYLSGSRGFKSGGFDARSNKPPVAGGNATNSGTFEFEDEEATTYELGFKSRIGGRAEVNAAAFYTDYKDLQTSAFDGVIGFNVGNGSAKVRGVELEGRWQATPRLRLNGSLATLDFEWTNYFGQCAFGATPDGTGVNLGNCNHAGKGNQLAPEMTAVIGGEYSLPIRDVAELRFAVDATYTDDYLLSLNLDPNAMQKSFTKLNARVDLSGLAKHWSVALVGRNLTDKTTLSYAGDTPLASRLFTARSYYGFVDQPRSVALEVGFKF